jgi:hypothetical protein
MTYLHTLPEVLNLDTLTFAASQINDRDPPNDQANLIPLEINKHDDIQLAKQQATELSNKQLN